MHRKLILAVLLSACMIGGVSAQSKSRNSYNKNESAMMKKQKRMEAKQELKIAKKIQKDSFAGIKLDKAQTRALNALVKSNYPSLAKADMQMQSLIPKDKVKALRKSYTASKKDGLNESDAMRMSMKEAGLADSIQDQVMAVRESKEAVMQEIAASVSEMLDDEQKKMLMAKAEEKEEMMEKKEEMMDKEEMDSAVSVTISLPGMT